MKNSKPNRLLILPVTALLLICAFGSSQAQTTPPPTSTQETATPQTQTQTQPQAPNIQTQLNLTPEQIQKWRALNMELKEQEGTVNSNLREARRAFSEAMESPTPNEELIKQRAKELADAQSAKTQLEALRQARVLQILTPEQRVRLREIKEEIRVRNQALRRANQQGLNPNQQPGVNALRRRQQVQQGTNTQALTPAQRKAMRQQQKKP